jgi:hypothetical protein
LPTAAPLATANNHVSLRVMTGARSMAVREAGVRRSPENVARSASVYRRRMTSPSAPTSASSVAAGRSDAERVDSDWAASALPTIVKS